MRLPDFILDSCLLLDGLDVKDIRLVKLSDGRSKGFAFVEFESADGLTQSLQANGQVRSLAPSCSCSFLLLAIP